MSLEDDLHEVQGSAEQIADLWEKSEEMDSADLGRYAIGLGFVPPQESLGYPWEVVVSHPNIFEAPDRKVLAWLGPDSSAPDESELWEDPAEGDNAPPSS